MKNRDKPLAFLLVGAFNTAFGYFASVALYYALESYLHIVVIGLVANVICISVSFFMYKFFVFKSRNAWWTEYLRCYVVYGGSAVIGVAGLWLFVNIMNVPFWLAQGLLMGISVLASYIGHDKFTFKKLEHK